MSDETPDELPEADLLELTGDASTDETGDWTDADEEVDADAVAD